MADSFLKLLSGGTKSKLPGLTRRKKGNDSGPAQTVQLDSSLISTQFSFFGDSQKPTNTPSESIHEGANKGKSSTTTHLSLKQSKYIPPKRSKKDLRAIQREHAIDVQGEDIPPLVCTFEEMQYYFKFPKYILNNLLSSVAEGGFQFQEPTPIQMQAIPALLSNREVLAFAPTGSGKTLAFALPMVSKLLSTESSKSTVNTSSVATKEQGTALPFHALIISPTRELSLQTYRVVKKLVRRNTVFSEDGQVVHAASEEASLKEKDRNDSIRINVSLMTKAFKRRLRTKVRSKVASQKAQAGLSQTQKGSQAAPNTDDDSDSDDDDDDGNDDDEDEDEDEDDEEEVTSDDVDLDDHDHDSDQTKKHRTRSQTVKTILVTTPMMLISLFHKTRSSLPFVESIVIDEADRLFDMGFLEQMNIILSKCTNLSILKTLVSATINPGVETIASRFLRSPIRITVGGENVAQMLVRQQLQYVGNEDGKLFAFNQMMINGLPIPMLVFVQSKERAIQFYDEYKFKQIHVGLIHSDLPEQDRLKTITDFRIGKVWVLVCTDLMSRGMNFQHVKCVVNYDFPQTEVSYIHRIGRTGRGGNRGLAITFVTEEDKTILRNIAEIANNSRLAQQKARESDSSDGIPSAEEVEGDIPSWMLKLPRAKARDVLRLTKRAPMRDDIRFVKKSVREQRKADQEKGFHLRAKAMKKVGLRSRNETGQLLSDRMATTNTKSNGGESTTPPQKGAASKSGSAQKGKSGNSSPANSKRRREKGSDGGVPSGKSKKPRT